MAEFLVPAVGLGFLWIISNQKKEGYTNIQKGELGNSGLIPKNYSKKFYPINLNNQSIEKNLKNNTRVYKSQKDETKKYYDSTFQQKQNEIN